MIRTYNYRVKNGNHVKWLKSRALVVSFMWNWRNDIRKCALGHNDGWLSGFDLSRLPSGCGAELEFHNLTCLVAREKHAGPRNIRGFEIMEWEYPARGTEHDRDQNASANILRPRHKVLAEGSLTL